MTFLFLLRRLLTPGRFPIHSQHNDIIFARGRHYGKHVSKCHQRLHYQRLRRRGGPVR